MNGWKYAWNTPVCMATTLCGLHHNVNHITHWLRTTFLKLYKLVTFFVRFLLFQHELIYTDLFIYLFCIFIIFIYFAFSLLLFIFAYFFIYWIYFNQSVFRLILRKACFKIFWIHTLDFYYSIINLYRVEYGIPV